MIILSFDLTDSENITVLIFAILFAIALFFILRQLNLWYWRIDESISIQKEQLELLNKLVNHEAITWECIKCDHKNPNDTYQCEKCDYSLK